MPLFAVIGHPIAHSLSPAMHNAALQALGIDGRYEAWDTPPESLATTVARLRSGEAYGLNVTVPHKEAVMSLLDAIEPTAMRIGAVNCVVVGADGRLVGHNTDWGGFLRSLREAGCEPKGLNVLV